MLCSERDQDILLLVHGELNGWRKLSTLNHLRTCPRCQEKQDQLVQVSRHLAGSIRLGGAMAPFVFRGTPVSPATPQLAPTTPATFSAPVRRPIRPAFLAGVTAVAAIIVAGAYVYKAMALAPVEDSDINTMYQASGNITPHATPGILGGIKASPGTAVDANGKPTIFPYSTPNMGHVCRLKKT